MQLSAMGKASTRSLPHHFFLERYGRHTGGNNERFVPGAHENQAPIVTGQGWTRFRCSLLSPQKNRWTKIDRYRFPKGNAACLTCKRTDFTQRSLQGSRYLDCYVACSHVFEGRLCPANKKRAMPIYRLMCPEARHASRSNIGIVAGCSDRWLSGVTTIDLGVFDAGGIEFLSAVFAAGAAVSARPFL